MPTLTAKEGDDGSVDIRLNAIVSERVLYDRLDVGYQRFQWQGRPLPAHDDPTWDALAYLDRRAAPAHVDTVRLPQLAAGNAGAYALTVDGPVTAHYRVFGTLRPRYAAAYASASGESVGTVEREHSKRLTQIAALRRARPSGALPPPLLKLIVPLTSDVSQFEGSNRARATAVADALVALNEQWGLFGGFAEDLEVAVETASRRLCPVNASNARTSESPQCTNGTCTPVRVTLPEAGHDPLVDVGPASTAEAQENVLLDMSVTGPIGHGFDSDPAAAVFPATSFVVHAPPLAAGLDFAKLQLRRWIDPRYIRVGAGRDALASCAVPGSAAGPWDVDAASTEVHGTAVVDLYAAVPPDGSPSQLLVTLPDVTEFGEMRVEVLPSAQSGDPALDVAVSYQSPPGDVWAYALPKLIVTGKACRLRVLLKRLLEPSGDRPGSGDAPPAWELTVYAGPTDGRVRRATTVRLRTIDGVVLPPSLGLRVERVAGAVSDVVLTAAPVVSAYTAGEWMQFLPHRDVQAVPGLVARLALPENGGGVDATPVTDEQNRIVALRMPSGPRLQSKPAAPGENGQGLVQRIAVVRMDRDAGGHPQPTYLGLLKETQAGTYEFKEEGGALTNAGDIRGIVLLVRLNVRTNAAGSPVFASFEQLADLAAASEHVPANATLDTARDAACALVVASSPFRIRVREGAA
jgi:hypothetical protein